MRPRNGFSLLEALVAILMLSLLMAGAVSTLRISLKSSEHVQSRIAAQNRVSRIQTDLREQVTSLMPVSAQCNSAGGPGASIPFFEGAADEMRLVSGYSLEDKFRGSPQVVEFKVLAGGKPGEFRLIVNERNWPGASFVAPCIFANDPMGMPSVRFRPVQSFPSSFVLADKLVHCGFSYLNRHPDGEIVWEQRARPGDGFPEAVRVDMTPEPRNSALAGLTNVVIPVRARGEL